MIENAVGTPSQKVGWLIYSKPNNTPLQTGTNVTNRMKGKGRPALID